MTQKICTERSMQWIKEKIPAFKDIVQITRDILVIYGTIWAFWKAPPIVEQKEIETRNSAEVSFDQLRVIRLKNLQMLNDDIMKIDKELKDVPWKGGLLGSGLKLYVI